jgi:hypothetical protein
MFFARGPIKANVESHGCRLVTASIAKSAREWDREMVNLTKQRLALNLPPLLRTYNYSG